MAAATNVPIKQPHPDTLTKGPFEAGVHLISKKYGIWTGIVANGTPVNGTSGSGAGWAGKGSTLVDATAGNWYRNTGTTASPVWVEMSTA